MKALLRKIRQILRDRKTRRIFTRLVSTVAAIVVFVTTYALVLPAITMESEAACGIEAHQHDQSCYTDVLVCEIPESPGHVHDESCYGTKQKQVCQIEEHAHDSDCYDGNGKLICEKDEHQHGEDCFEEVRELVCEIPESPGHQHDDSCYQKVLTCGKEVHTHSAACYHADTASQAATEAIAVASTESAAAAATGNGLVDNLNAPAEYSESETSLDSSIENNVIEGNLDALPDNTEPGSDSTSLTNEGDKDEPGAWTSTEATADATAATAASTGASAGAAGSTGSTTGGTAATAAPAGATDTMSTAAGYVPVLDELNFDTLLNKHTGIYYSRLAGTDSAVDNEIDGTDATADTGGTQEEAAAANTGETQAKESDLGTNSGEKKEEAVAENTGELQEVATWNRIDKHTELKESDNLRLYLAYTIPAGSLNETNQTARYSLPKNIHLTDEQVDEINATVNGIAGQYVSYDTLEILDQEMYGKYLGIEAVEGTRTPADDLEEYLANNEGQEFISATVKVENVFDENTGLLKAQDLVFTFAPYTIQKNQHQYDSEGQPIKAGEEVNGWLAIDISTEQIDWEKADDETKTADIIFVEKDKKSDLKEIRTELRLVGAEVDSDTDTNVGNAANGVSSDVAATDNKQDGTKDSETAAGESDKAEKEPVSYPSVSFDDSITVAGGSLSTDTDEAPGDAGMAAETEITVHVEADKDTFPEGTTMVLSAVSDEQMTTVAEAVEGAVDAPKTMGFHAVDISFRDVKGNEIEPLKPIRVSMTSDAIRRAVQDESTAPVVVHVSDPSSDQNAADENTDDGGSTDTTDADEAEGADSQPILDSSESTEEQVPGSNLETIPEANIIEIDTGTKENNGDTLTFDADAFSVYAIVYTVDFHWEMDGKEYEFSIPGGGFVSLEHLVEVLGIGVSDPNNENEKGKTGNVTNGVAENMEDIDDTQASGNGSAAYDEAIKLNEVEVSERSRKFVEDVESVEFSNPDLVWVGKVDEEATVGGLKESIGLTVTYSADLTEEQITEINAQTVEAGDWVLISIQPFTSEEAMAVTMKNGEQLVVKVTDANVTVDPSFDGTEGFIIYTIKNGNYYALNNQTGNNWWLSGGESDLATLGNEFKWTIDYVYQEKENNVFDTGYNYYKVRSYTDRSKYLYVGVNGAVVRSEATNVHIIPNPNPGQNSPFAIGGRFDFAGTHWMTALACDNNGYFYPYAANATEWEPTYMYAPIYIYRQNNTSFEFIVQTEDIRKGSVSGKDLEGNTKTNVGLFETKTNATSVDNNKTNLYPITATPSSNRLMFDHWTLNDVELDKSRYGSTIQAGGLKIPGNGAVLEAHFVKNPNYEPTDEEKEGRDAIDKDTFDTWLNGLVQNQQPLVEEACNKTAEVYDYENRIYRVDLTAESNMSIFDGDIDLGFIIDVSASMKFPSKLINATDVNQNTVAKNISTINWDNNASSWGLSTDKTYYVITDPSSTSTVCELTYKTLYRDNTYKTQWWLRDASKAGDGDYFDPANPGTKAYYNTSDKCTYVIKEADDLVTGDETGTIAQVIRDKGLQVGQPKTRAVYLEASIKDAIAEMYSIKQRLSVAANGSNDYQPKIAYNQFCGYIYSAQLGFVPAPQNGNVVTNYSYDGGTSTDVALLNAAGYVRSDVGAGNAYERDKNASGYYSHWNRDLASHTYSEGTGVDKGFQWDENSQKRYAILITDGAPQRSSRDIDPAYITEAAEKLKSKGVQLISVGLSMKDVPKGSGLLYSISNEDELGVPYYYKAETGDKLSNVIYETLQDTISSAIISGNVTDTIGQAFYPVDKKTGNPLSNGDWIALNGEKVNKNYTGEHGVITVTREMKNGKQENVYTVRWEGQDIKTHDKGGWHGRVYVKAKEDLIGGNGVNTNDGKATIQTTHFKNKEDATPIELKQEYKRTKQLDSPKVNVNELSITNNDTEWTVYVGEEVDPLDELKKLYNQMDVIQVINSGTNTNNDSFIDRVSNDTNSQHTRNENMFYPLPANLNEMESDGRENQGSGTRLTFKLSDLIKELQGGSDIDWDTLLAEAEKTGTDSEHPEEMNQGIEIPYHPYGINDDSKFIVKLTKEIVENEPDISENPHRTNVVGDGVEKYTLTVYYEPDYKVLPTGQYGEADISTYHVGSFESQSQGNAAGREMRENQHIINVYAKSLDILKLYDETDKTSVVQGAEFRLYRAAKGTESIDDAEFLSKYSLSGMHRIDTQTTNTAGIAHMAAVSEGKQASELLNANDGPYYLIEYSAPAGYKKDETVRQITVTTNDNIYKEVTGTVINSNALDSTTHKPKVAYNWEQGMRLAMSNGTVIIANPSTHQAVTLPGSRAYVKDGDSMVFQTEIINIKATSINIIKEDEKGDGLAEAVFQLKVVKNGSDVLVKTDNDYKNIEGVGDVAVEIDGQTKTFGSAVKTNGEIQNITGLLDGTYKLVEVMAPPGYIIIDSEIVFTVSNGVITSTTASSSDKVRLDPASANTVALLTVTNEPGTALPNTGGPGTSLIYLFGIMLTGLAGMSLLIRKRRKAT